MSEGSRSKVSPASQRVDFLFPSPPASSAHHPFRRGVTRFLYPPGLSFEICRRARLCVHSVLEVAVWHLGVDSHRGSPANMGLNQGLERWKRWWPGRRARRWRVCHPCAGLDRTPRGPSWTCVLSWPEHTPPSQPLPETSAQRAAGRARTPPNSAVRGMGTARGQWRAEGLPEVYGVPGLGAPSTLASSPRVPSAGCSSVDAASPVDLDPVLFGQCRQSRFL